MVWWQYSLIMMGMVIVYGLFELIKILVIKVIKNNGNGKKSERSVFTDDEHEKIVEMHNAAISYTSSITQYDEMFRDVSEMKKMTHEIWLYFKIKDSDESLSNLTNVLSKLSDTLDILQKK